MFIDLLRNTYSLLKKSFDEFSKNNLEEKGAALAYYSLFSIFPFFLILFSLLGYLLRFWSSAINFQAEILYQISINSSEQVSNFIQQGLDVLKNQAVFSSLVGFLLLLWSATQVFEYLHASLSRLWKREEKRVEAGLFHFLKGTIRSKLFALLMIFSIGLLAILSIGVTALSHVLIAYLKLIPFIGIYLSSFILIVTTLFLNSFIFALVYKYLSGAKPCWKNLVTVSIFTAILWEIVKRLVAFYLSHSNYLSAYKSIEIILILIFWIYMSAQILYFGASFLKVCMLKKEEN